MIPVTEGPLTVLYCNILFNNRLQPILSSVVPSIPTASTVTPIMTSSIVQEQSDELQRTLLHQSATLPSDDVLRPMLPSDDVPRALVQPRQSSEEPVAGPSFIASPPGIEITATIDLSSISTDVSAATIRNRIPENQTHS